MAAKVGKHKSISRIDYEKKHMHGWYVRVVFQGETHSRFFSDRNHLGKRNSLAAAIKWRNKKEKELGKPRTNRRVPSLTARNRTGILGIRRTIKDNSPVYEVSWHPSPFQLCRTSISIAKYGEEEAFQRACDLRREKELEIYGCELSPFFGQK